MRIRLQLLLPLAVGLLVAAGFIVAAIGVADAVHGALPTVPGLARERAVEAAVAAVTLAGIVFTAMAVVLATWLARLTARPLRRLTRTADLLEEQGGAPPLGTVVGEVQDVARAVLRAGAELRHRHERERQERAELAGLVEAVSEGIMQTDAEGRVIRLNPACRMLLGLPQDAVGRPVASLFRSEELRRLVARPADGSRTEVAEVVLDDRRLMTSVSRQPDGGVVATFVDLTDLRRLEEVRRDFVANASHELKTPLTSIRGYAESLLTADLPAPERRQFLETISRNALRLQRIVDDLLDLSRFEAGRWQPALEPVPIVEVARRAWLPFADRAAESAVSFATDGPPNDAAMADRRALEQVFANLYDNALRHTSEHGRIAVRVHHDEHSAGQPGRPSHEPPERQSPETPEQRLEPPASSATPWLMVEVVDTGSGIPRDALPRIFERFYRVDPARSRAEGGTGLGLAIVKHVIESMGGEVAADSVLGKGTAVRLWLPRAP